MSISDKLLNDKLEAARRERARAEALVTERDAINRALLSRPSGPDRLSSEQSQAFADSADEHLTRAHELEHEAATYKTKTDTLVVEHATRAADDLRLLRGKVQDSRDRSTHNAAERYLASAPNGGRMDDAAYGAFMRSVRNTVDMDQFDEHLAGMERRHRDRIAVVNEARVYGPDSVHSYFLDRATIGRDGVDPAGAQARMARYGVELATEVRERSPEGRRVERVLGEECRSDIAELNRQLLDKRQTELRALVSGGGATASAGSGAAAFVSPYFAEEAFAPYRVFIAPLRISVIRCRCHRSDYRCICRRSRLPRRRRSRRKARQ